MPWGLCALIVLAGLAAYGNSFTGSFIFDDEGFIVDNDVIPSPWPIRPLVASTGWESRLVVMLSLALNYALGGLDVFGYHLVNLAIHLLAGLTLFGLLRRTLKLVPQYSAEPIAADFLAVAVALIWLVHPLQTQSVTYVIQRTESLMGLFYLVCLYCVLRGSQASRSWPWYVAAVAACWLGMGTKQVMVTAPVVVLLYDRTFLAGSWKEVLRRRWALYLGFVPALVWLGVVTVQAASRAEQAAAGFGMQGITKLQYLGTQGGVILHYLRLAFWPDQLCLDYLWPVAESARAIFLPGAVVAALLVASFIAIRYRPRLGFLGLSFFLILAPTSSIMPIADLAFEHRMYLPLAPLVVLVVLAWERLAKRFVNSGRARQLLGAGLLGIVVVSLALRTMMRNRDYQDPVTMWTDVLVTAPHNARAHNNLGSLYERQGDLLSAADHYQRGLRIAPNFVDAHNNLGKVLTKQGKFDEALAHFEHALRIKPNFADAHYGLALVLQQEGKLVDAVAHFRHAIRSRPDHAETHYLLALVLTRQRNFDQAIAHFERALRLKPDYAQAHNDLGGVLERQENLIAAAAHFEQAIRIKPNFARAHYNLGNLLTRQGKLTEATDHYRHALRVNSTYAEAHNSLGQLLQNEGRFDEAGDHYQQAIRFKADYADAHANLGVTRGLQGSLAQAIVHYERALAIRPDFAEVHVNLGNALLGQGDDARAKTHLEQAIRLKPDLAQPHAIFGDMYRRQGNLPEAIARYREALRLDPGLLPAANTLAWILACCNDAALRDGEEAVRLAERLAAATGHKDPVVLDTLAAAYAEAGHYDEAVATARKAIELAAAAGQNTLAGQIEESLQLYRQQKPFRDRAAP